MNDITLADVFYVLGSIFFVIASLYLLGANTMGLL